MKRVSRGDLEQQLAPKNKEKGGTMAKLRSLVFFLLTGCLLLQGLMIYFQSRTIIFQADVIINYELRIREYQKMIRDLLPVIKFPEWVSYTKEEYAKILKERR